MIAVVITSALDAGELHASAVLPSEAWLRHRTGLDVLSKTEMS